MDEMLKHLPGKHDQAAHAGNRAAGMKPSSLSSRLVGTKLPGKTTKVTGVFKYKQAVKANVRLVEYADGSKEEYPTAVLQTLAFKNPRGKPWGAAGKMFKTPVALHKNGFTSYAQANYLLGSKPAVFDQLVEAAMAGTRVWDPKLQKQTVIKVSKAAIGGYADYNDIAEDDLWADLETLTDKEAVAKYARPVKARKSELVTASRVR